MRIKSVRKLVSIVLSIVVFASSMLYVSASEVVPCYNNVSSAESDVSVSGSGLLTILYRYNGNNSFTRVEVNTLVERQTLYFFWSDVAEWTDVLTDISYTDTTTLQLAEKGTYRITVEYTFYGLSEECDTITCEIEVKY